MTELFTGNSAGSKRESSKRKAKEKTDITHIVPEKVVETVEEERDNSDFDPGWSPVKEEEKRKKRGRPSFAAKKRKAPDSIELEAQPPRKGGRKKRNMDGTNKKLFCKIDEKLIASVSDEDIDISPYKVSSKFLKIIYNMD